MKLIQIGLPFLYCIGTCAVALGSDAPYPHSKIIAGINFDRSTLVKAAPGSDQFGYTTASDGNIYIAWGDGGGFGGTNSRGRASLGVTRLLGVPPTWKGINVWGGVKPLSSQPATHTRKNQQRRHCRGWQHLSLCLPTRHVDKQQPLEI